MNTTIHRPTTDGSWAITDTITKLCTLYTDLTPVVSDAFGSDYVPFEAAGEVITGLYQNARDAFSHQPADTLENMDTTSYKQAVRLTAAATIYFAQVPQFVNVSHVAQEGIRVYPNPTIGVLHVELPLELEAGEFELRDILGKVVHHQSLRSTKVAIDVRDISPGLYHIHIDRNKPGSLTTPVLLVSPLTALRMRQLPIVMSAKGTSNLRKAHLRSSK